MAATPTTLLVLLQNPWSPAYAGGTWPRASWLAALRESTSGRRLAAMLPWDWDDPRLHFDNANPVATAAPSGRLRPNRPHILALLARLDPAGVLACGGVAADGLAGAWDGPQVSIPHPAYRHWTALACRAVNRRLGTWLAGTGPRRTRFLIEPSPGSAAGGYRWQDERAAPPSLDLDGGA